MNMFRAAVIGAATCAAFATGGAYAQYVQPRALPAVTPGNSSDNPSGGDTTRNRGNPPPRTDESTQRGATDSSPTPSRSRAPGDLPVPVPTEPGRADPDKIPDPHPTGKTSDEGSTPGSAPAAPGDNDAAGGASSSTGRAAAPSSDSSYSGAKSSDPNDKSNRRVPAQRDRPSQ